MIMVDPNADRDICDYLFDRSDEIIEFSNPLID